MGNRYWVMEVDGEDHRMGMGIMGIWRLCRLRGDLRLGRESLRRVELVWEREGLVWRGLSHKGMVDTMELDSRTVSARLLMAGTSAQ